MRVKTLTSFMRSGGGLIEPGAIIDLDLEAYDRHEADGNVVAVEVAEAIERGEAEAKRIRDEAEAKAKALVLAARERGSADIDRAKAAAAEKRGPKSA